MDSTSSAAPQKNEIPTGIERLSHVTIVVKDQNKALDFYTKALGLEKRADYSVPGNPRWLTVAPKGQDIEMTLWQAGSWEAGSKSGEIPSSLNQPGAGTQWTFITADCRKTYAELKARGVVFRSEPAENPYSTVAEFTDPDGNPFRLVQLKSASASQWKKGE